MSASLPLRHALLALLVVTIWGSNFIAIQVALRDLPPLLLCTLRFLLVPLPLVFFLPRPAVSFGQLLTYGATMFACQFALLFVGMKLGFSPGLTSLVLQFQVFVTLALAAAWLKERVTAIQVAGAAVAFAGFAVVARHTGGEVTAAGLVCVLLAAVSWSFGNLTARRLGKVNALALVVWGSLVVPLPMGLASLAFEGPGAIAHSLTHVRAPALLGLLYIAYLSTVVAYSLWSWLLARHPAASVTPFALLVPVVGLLSSAWMLGEALPGWKLQAAALVLAGLGLNVFGPRLLATLRPAAPAA